MSGLRRLKRKQERQEFGVSGKLFDRMTHEHVDVLQNVEFSLLSVYRSNRSIDDHAVASALKAVISGGAPTDDGCRPLVAALEDVRHVRPDVSDELWRNALKVVLESVGNHSAQRPGDTDYLDFIAEFVQ